jgi:hypothetical protein
MLRIQRRPPGKVVVLALSGRIGAEDLEALQRLLEAEPGDGLVLDLKELRLVDREAVVFLAAREANGTTLENCPPYVREWIARQRDAR